MENEFETFDALAERLGVGKLTIERWRKTFLAGLPVVALPQPHGRGRPRLAWERAYLEAIALSAADGSWRYPGPIPFPWLVWGREVQARIAASAGV